MSKRPKVRPKIDITSVLAPERASVKARSRTSIRAANRANTEILHVYMPAELKDRFRKIQAQLQLERAETWKLSDIARAVLTIGLNAGEDQIIRYLDEAKVG